LTDEQIAIIKDGFAAAGVEKVITFTNAKEMKLFFTADEADIEQVTKWVSKDGDNVKFIKIGDDDTKNFDIPFDNTDVNSWTSADYNHVKVIKL
jgi:hypothetical protein